jgi:hypothetical protein
MSKFLKKKLKGVKPGEVLTAVVNNGTKEASSGLFGLNVLKAVNKAAAGLDAANYIASELGIEDYLFSLDELAKYVYCAKDHLDSFTDNKFKFNLPTLLRELSSAQMCGSTWDTSIVETNTNVRPYVNTNLWRKTIRGNVAFNLINSKRYNEWLSERVDTARLNKPSSNNSDLPSLPFNSPPLNNLAKKFPFWDVYYDKKEQCMILGLIGVKSEDGFVYSIITTYSRPVEIRIPFADILNATIVAMNRELVTMEDIAKINDVIVASASDLYNDNNDINNFRGVKTNEIIYSYNFNNNKTICVSAPPKLSSWIGKQIEDLYEPGSDISNHKLVQQVVDKIKVTKSFGKKNNQLLTVRDSEKTYAAIVDILPKIQSSRSVGDNNTIEFSHKLLPYTPTRVKELKDKTINGTFKVLGKSNNAIMSTNTALETICFSGKVGINQESKDISGLLDIDNNSQEQITIINQSIKESLLTLSQKMSSMKNSDGVIVYNSSKNENYVVIGCPISSINKNVTINMLNPNKKINLKPQSQESIKNIINELSYYKMLDTKHTFNFIELLADTDNNTFICVMSGFVTKENGVSKITFFTELININYFIRDTSLSDKLVEILLRYSNTLKCLNFAMSLLYTDSVKNQIINNNNNLLFTNLLNDNKFTLRCGSLYGIVTDNNNLTYLFNETYPEWNGRELKQLFIGDENVGEKVHNLMDSYKKFYGPMSLHTGLNESYLLNDLVVSFLHEITIVHNGVSRKCMIGVDVDMSVSLVPSIKCRGDNKFTGNFSVLNENEDVIFNVNNSKKTINNMYNVGIGTNDPHSSLHVKDNSVEEVVSVIRDSSVRDNNLISALNGLKSINMNNLADINTEMNKYTQTSDMYYTVLELSDTLGNLYSPKNVKYVYYWPQRDWEGKTVSQLLIEDEQYNNTSLLTTDKEIFREILNSYIFDGGKQILRYLWANGIKISSVTFFRNNNKLYALGTGQNVQSYGLQINTKSSLLTHFNCEEAHHNYLQSIYLHYNQPSFYVNLQSLQNSIDISRLTFPVSTYTRYTLVNNMFESVSKFYFDGHGQVPDSNKVISTITEFEEKSTIISYVFCYQRFYDWLVNGFGKLHFETPIYNCESLFFKQGNYIYSVDFVLEKNINPSVDVEGDVRAQGNLIVHNKQINEQYFTVDPVNKFVGINTDVRDILYNTGYTTTNFQGANSGQHHVYIKSDTYPNLACERICDLPSSHVGSYTSFSASTMKRHSETNTFKEMYEKTPKTHQDIAPNSLGDNMYGVDISFEMSDKTNVTQELGNLIVGVDSVEPNGRVKAGFAVRVNDVNEVTSSLVPRNILHVDNNGCLSVNSIKMNGYTITVNNDGELVIVKS